MNLTSAHASVQQPASNAQDHAHDVRDPIVDVGATVEAGLDEFNGTPKRARADEDGQQAKAPRPGQRKGECGEGYEVHQLVAALRRWGRLMNRPKHGHCQNCGYNQSEGDIEILAHANRLTAPGAERKQMLSPGVFAVKVKDSQNQGLGCSNKYLFVMWKRIFPICK